MKRLSLLFIALLCTACATAPPPPKEVFYRFNPASQSPGGQQVIDGNLRLEPIRAQGILSERALIFSQASHANRLEQYRYHHWEKPPAQLLTQALLNTLQGAGIAQQVVPADVRSHADYSIDGELLRLERVLGKKQDSVTVEILLRLKRYSTRQLVLQKRYAASREVRHDSLPEVVASMSAARDEIFSAFLKDIRQHRISNAEPPPNP